MIHEDTNDEFASNRATAPNHRHRPHDFIDVSSSLCKCISSPCKMYLFRLQNAFLPIAKCIFSHYKKLSFIFYFEINLFHMQNVVLSRAKFISSDCKMCKMRSFPMENVHPFPSLQIAFLRCYSMYPCIPCIPPV